MNNDGKISQSFKTICRESKTLNIVYNDRPQHPGLAVDLFQRYTWMKQTYKMIHLPKLFYSGVSQISREWEILGNFLFSAAKAIVFLS